MQVITVASDVDAPGFKHLADSLQLNEWEAVCITTQWKGFGTKIISTYEHLKAHPEVEEFVFVDAYDVVALGDKEEFIKKLPFKGCMVFSAERGCWPDDSVRDVYPHYPHGFNFLNSGLYYSKSDLFIKIVEENTPNFHDDDQLYFTKIFLSANYRMMLDNNCEVFQSYSFIQDDDFSYDHWRVQNLKTGTEPIFLHGNGKTDMTKVLNLLKDE